MKKWAIAAVVSILVLSPQGFPQESTQEERIKEIEKKLEVLTEEIEKMKSDRTGKERIGEIEKKLEALTKEVEEIKSERVQERARHEEEKEESFSEEKEYEGLLSGLTERVRVGGYGSFRYETFSIGNEDLNNTFTFRRFVLTTDATPVERLRAYFELEFERFAEIEVEEGTTAGEGGLSFEQEIEATNESEIAVEQAWVQFNFAEDHGLRLGAILVPLGRFNLFHDDNLYDFNRRPITDRQGPVLPIAAAWDELGAGLVGNFGLGDEGRFDYQLYVMNGATLDGQIETKIEARDPKRDKLELEGELEFSQGSFSRDLDGAKAFTGRVALSPFLGAEVGGSFYIGQYTPDFLDMNEYIAAFGADTKLTFGPIDFEAEYIFTNFGGAEDVVTRFAELVRDSSVETESEETANLEIELEFEPSMITKSRQGFWVSLTYHFWPEFLNETPLGAPFENPDLRLVGRYEIVNFDDLFTLVEFEEGLITELATEDRTQQLITLGLSYRPIPLIALIFNFEIGDLIEGDALIFPRDVDEDKFFAFTAGMVFGL